VSFLVWGIALVVYLFFVGWYYNWLGPIKAYEVDQYIKAFADNSGAKNTDVNILRRFLAEDDGKEFIMQNFVKLHKGKIIHPETGQEIAPGKLVGDYIGPFVKALLKRGGHPVLRASKVGGYIDSWEYDSDPEWGVVAMMRYKSRRDLVELILDPRFAEMHVFKKLAIEKTVSFPLQMQFSFFMNPKFSVPLILLLLASLMQNLLWFFR